MPTPDASVSTTKSAFLSGMPNPTAFIRSSLTCSKALWQPAVQVNFFFLAPPFSRSDSGAVFVAKSRTKLDRYCINPRNLCKAGYESGGAYALTAAILSSDTWIRL